MNVKIVFLSILSDKTLSAKLFSIDLNRVFTAASEQYSLAIVTLFCREQKHCNNKQNHSPLFTALSLSFFTNAECIKREYFYMLNNLS